MPASLLVPFVAPIAVALIAALLLGYSRSATTFRRGGFLALLIIAGTVVSLAAAYWSVLPFSGAGVSGVASSDPSDVIAAVQQRAILACVLVAGMQLLLARVSAGWFVR